MKAGLALLCVLLALASLALGPIDLAALWARDPDLARSLFIELRLPRTGLALAIGAGLGASGAAAQAFSATRWLRPMCWGHPAVRRWARCWPAISSEPG